MKKIYQLVSALSRHDAVSNYTLEIDKLLRESNVDTKIFVNHLAPDLQSSTIRPLQEFEQHIDDPNLHLIYQYSVHDPASEYYFRAKASKTFIYHNITPSHFFHGYNEPIAEICNRGRQMLPQLAEVTDQAIAISDYSHNELISHGFAPDQIETIPFLLSQKFLDRQHQGIKSKSSKSDKQLLFVGKIAPHKKIEDIIKAFFLYHKHHSQTAQLNLVGALGKDLYEEQLRDLVNQLGLSKVVTFHGRVPDQKLSQFYSNADLFITMSEHEGFCVPLVEAMIYQIPILAYINTAIPNTMGDSGFQAQLKDPGILAEAIHIILTDSVFSQQLVASQTNRLTSFKPEVVKAKLQKKFDIVSN